MDGVPESRSPGAGALARYRVWMPCVSASLPYANNCGNELVCPGRRYFGADSAAPAFVRYSAGAIKTLEPRAREERALDRKAMVRQYKENPRPAGVFGVRNTAENVLLLGVSADLPGMLNRQRFQLEMGSHPDKALQADWVRLGPDAFVIEVLDELEMPKEPGHDPRDDLATLRDMWLDRMKREGQALYPTSMRGA